MEDTITVSKKEWDYFISFKEIIDGITNQKYVVTYPDIIVKAEKKIIQDEKCKERAKGYRQKNPEKFKERIQTWQENNKDKMSENSRRYYQRKKERIKMESEGLVC